MAKINSAFVHDIFKMLHRPIRDLDRTEGNNFVERFLIGPQNIFELTQKTIDQIKTLNNPATIRADLLQYLKDHVGFTSELNNITQGLEENDLRKLISLAVALWNTKGTEPGYKAIVRLFTGKTARVFNWFDFRMIVGEKAFGEEQLGEDSWLISVPGVEASSDPSNTVVSLLNMEGNAKDRSLGRNHGTIHGDLNFYTVPSSGFAQNSEKYGRFSGGVIKQSHSSRYDLSGSFTIEMFIRFQTSQSIQTLFHKMIGGVGVKIELDISANQFSFEVNDGTNLVTTTFVPTANIDDNSVKHLALVVDRAEDGARLFYGATEASAKIALGALGDVSNPGHVFISGEDVGVKVLKGDIDDYRLSLNAVYDVDTVPHVPPIVGFIPFIEEELDEFFSDIRIVDEGDLNKTLILRILNLMRPSSERLNVIFTRFFDDFIDGAGQFEKLSVPGSILVNINSQLELSPDTITTTDVLGDDDFQDIVLQVKTNITSLVGGVISILFFMQDINNFYEYRVDFTNKLVSLHKTVTSVSSQIGANISEDIVAQTSYILTVTTSKDVVTGDTLIKTFVDSNKQHQVIDSSFDEGKFGMKTDAGTTMQVDEIEMLELPVDVQQILPNFDL